MHNNAQRLATAIHQSSSGSKRSAKGPLAMLLLILSAACCSAIAAEPVDATFLQGVNLAGASFGGESIIKGGPRGRFGVNYVYPIELFVPGYRSPNYFVSSGMNTFRLSFLWERAQPKLGEELDAAEVQRLVQATDELLKLGAWVVLDLHNYARYEDVVIGSETVGVAGFSDVWRRLALLFKNKDHVIFGLMNEPHDIPTETWVTAANDAIRAIREAGAGNLILVPGNGWSAAHKWYDHSYGKPNAEALLEIADPLNRIAFEAHLYLDAQSSGTSDTCVSETIGVERLQPFERWLTEHKKLGFIGEFGAGRGDVCLNALSAMVRAMRDRSDVYLGWTYWAAGPWWPSTYFTLLEPRPDDAPQMKVLRPYLTALKVTPRPSGQGTQENSSPR